MKIFKWVQRKLHQNVIKDGMAKSVKKTESVAIDNNTLALLEQVALVDILTIGTFGFDPLKPSHEIKDDFLIYDENEDNDDEVCDSQIKEEKNENNESKECFEDEEEEMNPLMFTTIGHRVISAVDLADQGITEESDGEGKKKRTTLAELFLEDPNINFKKQKKSSKIELNYAKKLFGTTKNDVVLAKKITHIVKDSSRHELRSIKSKLGHMMKRMLKKKVHPDVDGDKINQSDVGPNKPIKTKEGSESVSLLPVPDHMS